MDNPSFVDHEDDKTAQPPASASAATEITADIVATSESEIQRSNTSCDSPSDSLSSVDSAIMSARTISMASTPNENLSVQHPSPPAYGVHTWGGNSQDHPFSFVYPKVDQDVAPTSPQRHNGEIAMHADPEPTDLQGRQKWFKYSASENISIMYTIFLVMLGIVMYTADMFRGRDSIVAESFNILLITVQVAWLLYVHIDARFYISRVSKMLEQNEYQKEGGSNPQAKPSIPLHYGFTSGRHGGSIYLKIGATVFCFGHMIHTGLNLAQKILYLTGDGFNDCSNIMDVTMSFIQPICAFYQLFFIFKYSNLIINRRLALSRFGLMHCIGSSLCYWIYTILQETLLTLYSGESNHNSTAHYARDSSTWSLKYGCDKDTYLSDMINYTTPYLFPFSIEFNILMVGLWMLLRENLGKVERHTHLPSVEVVYEGDHGTSLTSNLVIYVDCHSSNRGLFAGLFMTVVTVISIILLFILSSDDDGGEIGKYVNGICEVALLAVMVGAAIAAYKLIHNLDVIHHKAITVDDILLYVSLPCIFFYAFLRLAPSIMYSNALFATMAVLQILQVIIQTALIYDGMRRCSNSSALRHKKPGREVITFLVVVNVAFWLLQTFEVKTVGSNYEMYNFYGKELWTFLSHLTLPFALFYRFHSSGCLANMWMSVYEVDEVQ